MAAVRTNPRKEKAFYSDTRLSEEEFQALVEEDERATFAEHVIDCVSVYYEGKGVFTPFYYLSLARKANVVPQILELGSGLVEYNSMYCQIENLMVRDNKDEFAVFLTNYHHKLLSFEPQDLFYFLVMHSAVGCLTALLHSQLRSHVYVNRSLPSHCESPLYLAAGSLSFPMVKLLLHHGAHPDLPTLEETPLSIAISCFRSRLRPHWNPAKSIVELFHLIFSPQRKESLDTVKLLASQSKQVENLCFTCVANGDIIEFATLLAAAPDKLLAQPLENTPVVQYILEKLKCEANLLCERTKPWVDAFNLVKSFCLVNRLLERYGQSVLEDLSILVREG